MFAKKKLCQEIKEEYKQKLLEGKPSQETIDIKRKFNESLKVIQRLLNPRNNKSFRSVFENLAKGIDDNGKEKYFIDDFNKKYCFRIIVLENNFSSFYRLFNYSFDLEEIKESLLEIVKQIEQLAMDMSDEKENWNPEYDVNNMKTLITSYDKFISELNALYDQESWSDPKFHFLDEWLPK